jgi:hypothetical protein
MQTRALRTVTKAVASAAFSDAALDYFDSFAADTSAGPLDRAALRGHSGTTIAMDAEVSKATHCFCAARALAQPPLCAHVHSLVPRSLNLAVFFR